MKKEIYLVFLPKSCSPNLLAFENYRQAEQLCSQFNIGKGVSDKYLEPLIVPLQETIENDK